MKTTLLKWLALGLGVGGACLATAILHPHLAQSADHLDSPATKKEAAADINDVYTFTDGANAVFAMTVTPNAPVGAKFSDAVQYVLHTASTDKLNGTGTEVNVICTFDTAQKAQCWAGSEYATGDASTATGISSASGKLKVFAGLRADPFFFNLDGFKHTVEIVKGAKGQLAFDSAGCPTLDSATSNTLVTALQTSPDGTTAKDFFKGFNALAIVASIDKTIVTAGGPVVSVWASTNRKP